jgi:hypothetical protein
MRHGDRHSLYKGLRVTVRWHESPLAGSRARLFTSSYLIGDEHTDTDWHHVTEPVFHTFDTAAAFCLEKAKRVIDAMASRR